MDTENNNESKEMNGNRFSADKYIYIPGGDNPLRPGFHRTLHGQSNSKFSKFEDQLRFCKSMAGQAPCSDGMVVMPLTSASAVKSNPHYAAAKAGDYRAAEKFVERLFESMTDKARGQWNLMISRIKRTDLVAPVIAAEASGNNKIPLAFARRIAKDAGAELSVAIVQAVHANHTGANALSRVLSPVYFAGDVESCREYVVVDDFVTMGGTVAGMAGYIEAMGGKVKGVAALASSIRLPHIGGEIDFRPSEELIAQVRSKIGMAVEECLGIRLDSLTAPVLYWLRQFRDGDALKKRISESASSRRAAAYMLAASEIAFLLDEFNDDLWSGAD